MVYSGIVRPWHIIWFSSSGGLLALSSTALPLWDGIIGGKMFSVKAGWALGLEFMVGPGDPKFSLHRA